MARNNIKLLTVNELAHFNKRYHISIEDGRIAVRIDDYDRVTYHSLDEPFSINAKKIRKISFSKTAIQIWQELLQQKLKIKPTLVDVQQAIHLLYISYQPINVENVKEALSNPIRKIKII